MTARNASRVTPAFLNPPGGRKSHMDKGVAVILTAVVGALIALQAPINAGLGKATGSFPAALISFTVGVLVLLAIVIVSGQASGLGEVP